MTDGNASQFVIYQSENGQIKLDVRCVDETVWLMPLLMAELFGITSENVRMHLKNIYSEGELDPNSTAKGFGNSQCTVTNGTDGRIASLPFVHKVSHTALRASRTASRQHHHKRYLCYFRTPKDFSVVRQEGARQVKRTLNMTTWMPFCRWATA
ncbi:MAG: hypothetical protein K9J77_06565 [Rhodoferax sp.]|nr:hypothetical protein [Rhodoferax sp.]